LRGKNPREGAPIGNDQKCLQDETKEGERIERVRQENIEQQNVEDNRPQQCQSEWHEPAAQKEQAANDFNL
ncbi:MAG TPA: hypothetical protein VIS99_04790, partial [Terrimicrobiaceae bacterium]